MAQRVRIKGFGQVPLVNMDTCTVGAMEDLQDSTGWDNDELRRRVGQISSQGVIGLFLSLRSAGHEVTYEQVRGLSQSDMELLPEPKDRKPKKTTPDPTKAPRGSARGDGDLPETPAPQ